MTAVTAAEQTGLPPMVLLISPGPSTPITSPRAAMAETGTLLPIPLPMQRRSGCSPSHSSAQNLPVRPKEACTSSSVKRMPRARIHCSRRFSHPCGGKMKPAAPWYGSTITPARLPVLSARTTSSRNSRHSRPHESGFARKGQR